MIVEGNTNPGNPFTGDERPLPYYCPVCGRTLSETWGWTTVAGKSRYDSVVCYGWTPRWLVWLHRRVNLGIVTPTGAHYQYELPTRPLATADRFDRLTGHPR